MNNLRIIFMGTPEFAVPSLDILVNHGFEVVSVITAPDKPRGRGQKLGVSPIKELALSYKIPVLQPTNLKSSAFIQELKNYRANLQIVVAFRMLPEIVWSMPELGTFNLHASLLPKYRGAAPINWAIINGEKETGVTTFMLKHEIDTGSIIFQEREPIDPQDNAGSLYKRLMLKGAQIVLKTTQAISQGEITMLPQLIADGQSKAPKIYKEDCEINWNQSSIAIHNFVRGLSPFPGARTKIDGKIIKIYKTNVVNDSDSDLDPGSYQTNNQDCLKFKTSDGFVSIEDVQLEGKKRMKINEFLRGHKL
ncbi:MAG: methionyl-tRNA formyltransferase [Bacteroidetes bacterium]|nr:methionyl-tRNA formyltransferase [Bacteroidota bacterium]